MYLLFVFCFVNLNLQSNYELKVSDKCNEVKSTTFPCEM